MLFSAKKTAAASSCKKSGALLLSCAIQTHRTLVCSQTFHQRVGTDEETDTLKRDTHTHTHTRTERERHTHTHTHTNTEIERQAETHTHTHTHTHIHTYARERLWNQLIILLFVKSPLLSRVLW
jgi:hypothetical protein